MYVPAPIPVGNSNYFIMLNKYKFHFLIDVFYKKKLLDKALNYGMSVLASDALFPYFKHSRTF